MFSSRLPAALTPNRLTRAVASLRARGESIFDLTETNPTRVGLSYPSGLLAPLASPAGLTYEPSAPGLAVARQAVALEYLRHGIDVDPDLIFLTASTSEAYGFLFKLLCDPGDEVLTPRPSYPLFDHLTALEGVRAVPYALDLHNGWSLDLVGLERAITPRTRAVLIVSPNNPTGTRLKAYELRALVEICARHGLAIVGDEVFADYPLSGSASAPALGLPASAVHMVPGSRVPGSDAADAGPVDPFAAVSVLSQDRVLTFGLGGLSKSVGLPQVKLGWIVLRGPDEAVRAAADRLDLIGDTYLSVSTPVQIATPSLLEHGAAARAAIQARVRANLRAFERALGPPGASSCTLLPVEAGWAAVLRVPAIRSEEALVVGLLEQERVLVMPGYFYDFSTEAYLVVSLLPDPEMFMAGVSRMLAYLEVEPRG
jgi:aspartate/methionine/tyrosine aminotransferase